MGVRLYCDKRCKNKLLAMEMDYLRSTKLWRMDRIRNDKIRRMGGEETTIYVAERK
jgi:hypothetical protein